MLTIKESIHQEKLDYKRFKLGGFEFRRDNYFAHIKYPNGNHIISIDNFLKALMRDVAWDFFYGTVHFDEVFGTINFYGEVDVFVGIFNSTYITSNNTYSQKFKTQEIRNCFESILSDWANPNFDPFAAPRETGCAWGEKTGGQNRYITRNRIVAKKMVGLPDDTPIRDDNSGHTVNDHFLDVSQEEPFIQCEKGYEDKVHAINLFKYLSRSDVTWNPSVCSVLKDSLFCPTTEEYILPIIHGNDRIEWFIQLTDEITWDIYDKSTGILRAKMTMRPGDVAAMPANISHQGFSPKRSMLLVWENASTDIPAMIEKNELDSNPVNF